MGASAPLGISLDKAPPSPPSTSGPQAQLSGSLGQGQQAPGQSGMQETVQTAMAVEMGIQQLASTLPGFAPVAQQLINVLRSGVARSLQQAAGSGLGTGAPSVQGAGSDMSAPPAGVGMGGGLPS